MNKLKTIIQSVDEIRERMKTEGENAIKEAFAEFFAEHPEIKTISWRQYTPYFSDGDACYFSVHDFYFFGDVGPDPDDEDEEKACLIDPLRCIDFYNRNPQFNKKVRNLTEAEEKLLNSCTNFESAFKDAEDIFRMVFGDHVRVIATREGFEVQGYDHD